MSDTVEQIKSRLDIADVISGYIKVQKAGANYKARCPFHSEKTPSFHISPVRQSWHCFGCNKGGDMFSFVQEIEGVEFVEAMRILAAKAGVQVPERSSHYRAEADQRHRLLAVAELTSKFFEKQLWNSNAGARALEYLRKRGLTDETIRLWRLGWAPNDWRALTGFLQKAGHPDADIVAAGVVVQKDAASGKREARLYDRFRSRIMFPITDTSSQVVGFTGRVFGAEVAVDGEPLAKYVNTPQTAIYDKSRVLFGLDKAKTAMRSADRALLVEGNMDAIMASQAGVAHVVATSGTALTPDQLRMLARYSTNLDFCFDADQAGQAATRRGLGLALAQNFAVHILTLDDPDCKDPADYVVKHGTKFNERAQMAQPVMQYYFDAAQATFDPASAASKKHIIAIVGPLVKRLTSRVEQSHWVGQLAMLLRTDQASVSADVASVKDDIAQYERADVPPAQVVQVAAPVPVDPLSQELLAVVARLPALANTAAEVADFCDPRVGAILTAPERLTASGDDSERQLIDLAFLRAGELYEKFTDAELAAQVDTLSARLRSKHVKAVRSALMPLIAQAEQQHDIAKRDELLKEFQSYTEELNRLTT